MPVPAPDSIPRRPAKHLISPKRSGYRTATNFGGSEGYLYCRDAFFETEMGDTEDNLTWAGNHRLLVALVAYAGAGWVAVWLLTVIRQHAGLPENLDSGFIAVFLAGFVAMITLLKTHVAGGGPPIFHALRVVSLVLMFAATGLLVAHWLDPESVLATAPSMSVSSSEHPVILDASAAEDGCINPAVE